MIDRERKRQRDKGRHRDRERQRDKWREGCVRGKKEQKIKNRADFA